MNEAGLRLRESAHTSILTHVRHWRTRACRWLTPAYKPDRMQGSRGGSETPGLASDERFEHLQEGRERMHLRRVSA